MLTTLFGTRSLENPSTPLSSPDDWLYDALGARRSESGISINRTSVLKYSPVWRGVNLISRDVAKIPLLVYRRTGSGKERDRQHPAFRLLRRKPNPEMTAFVFKQTLTAHALLHGNGYAYVFRRGDGAPRELIPLMPDKTWPVRVGGRLSYVTDVNGDVRKLPPGNVVHIKGLGFDGLCGYALIEFGADSLGLGMAAQKYGSIYFRNSARPSVVIEVPQKLSDTAFKHLKDSWEQLHSGLENHHKVALLEEGAKINPFSINARDSQLLETREFEVREVANWLGVPPHKLGDNSRTAYNSLEQENQSYLDDALDGWLVNWEEECYDKLLTESEKEEETHVIEFLRQAIVRADLNTRGQFYTTALQNGWMNRDEVRSAENLNPIDDGEGEKFFIPLNMRLTGEEEAEVDAPGPQVVDSLMAVVDQLAQKRIPLESAKALVKAAFPMLTDEQVSEILTPAAEFKPEPPEPPQAPIPPNSEEEIEPEEPGEEEDDGEPEEDRAAIEAARQVFIDAVRRMTKRVSLHVMKAAKKANHGLPNSFDEIESDNIGVVREALSPVEKLIHSEGVADWLMSQFRTDLLAITGECRRDEFLPAVEEFVKRAEAEYPAEAVAFFMEME